MTYTWPKRAAKWILRVKPDVTLLLMFLVNVHTLKGCFFAFILTGSHRGLMRALFCDPPNSPTSPRKPINRLLQDRDHQFALQLTNPIHSNLGTRRQLSLSGECSHGQLQCFFQTSIIVTVIEDAFFYITQRSRSNKMSAKFSISKPHPTW